MAVFLAYPLSQFFVLSFSFLSFLMFYYQIFFWIYFQFFCFYFFMSMYLKSVRFYGIFTYASSIILLYTGVFFLSFCYYKIFLFFSFRSSYIFFAYSYSFFLSSSYFFCFSSFFFCISFLLYSMSFILRFISDYDNFSFLPSCSTCGFFSVFAGFFADFFFEALTMFFALAASFSLFGCSFGASLLFFCYFRLDLTLRIPASLSLELSINSDLAYDKSSSFLNSKSLCSPKFQLMTSSAFSDAISDSTSGSSSILYSSFSIFSPISSFISNSSGYSSSTSLSKSSLYPSFSLPSSPSESLISSSISACVNLFAIRFDIIQSYYIFYPVGMEKQAKGSKLQPLKKQPLPQERASFYSKESQMSRFKFSNTSQRYRTEPSVENIREELPKKHSKNKTEFSEEYMSLVNKLRVNLSKQLDKKNKIEIVREREYLYNNENRERNNTFVNIRDGMKKRPFVPKDPIMKLNKRSLTSFQRDSEPEVKTMRVQESSKAYQINFFKASQDSFNKEGYLPSMNTLHKGRYELNDTIKEVTQHNSPQKPKKNTKKKHKTSHKSKEKVVAIERSDHKHGAKHPYEQQQIKQLNESYSKLDELCFHIEILIDILQSMSAKENSCESPEKMIRILKDYILGNKKYVNNSLLLDDISHLDRIYKHQQGQKQLRTMVFYQRILIVYCIDLLATRSIQKHLHQISHIFHSFLGIYIYFLCVLQQAAVPLSNYVLASLQTFQAKISQHNIHIKKEITTTVFFISKKLFPILKTNSVLYKQLKIIVAEFQTRNVTINRSFYELLRLYAIYLNNHQHIIQKDYNVLKTFATCPSPYLTKPPQKRYTLVLDLDETLIHSSRGKQKLEIFMRPFLKEFLQVMTRSFEIVIFTSSMPDYSEDIISQLPFISHRLYRYHTTRLKNRHVKDLSRLGRQLQCIVMVDNEEQNFLLQKTNGIKITEWRGDNPSDQQLNILGLFLTQLISKHPQDLRQHIPNYKSFRKGYE